MLACVQGASDSLLHPSPGCEAEISVFGIAVRVLLRAASLPHCMVSSPVPGRGLSVSAFTGCSSALKAFLFCSAGSSRSPELLRCQRNFLWSGALSSLSPLLGCLSDSSELAWGFVEPLRTYELRCLASGCALHPSLCLGWAPWVIPCYVFSWLSFLERGCGVLCFRHRFCDEDSGPSLAPRVAGFTVPAPPTRDNRNGRLLYPVRAVRCYLFRFGCASSALRAVPFCRKV